MKDDTISRKAALDAIFGRSHEIIKMRIGNLPSAQPESAKRTAEAAQNVSDSDLISRKAAIDAVDKRFDSIPINQTTEILLLRKDLRELPSAQPKQQWISCSERLPKINQTVLLSTTDGEVIVGYRYKPDTVWQVTANDGRKIWVYDPENYSGNIDELPKAETCGFENRDNCWLSVTSINYDLKFAGISAWMPLPEPYKGDDHETD